MSIEILKSRFVNKDTLMDCNEDDDSHQNCWYSIDGIPHLFKKENNIKYLVNEMLGEDFGKYIDLKSAQYFIVRLSPDILRNYVCVEIKNERYVIVSKNFKENNKIYYTGKEIMTYTNLLHLKRTNKTYLNRLSCFRNFCLDDENYKRFKENMFKKLILGFFIGQLDGQYEFNNIFEKDLNGIFDLSPTLDFACSFEIDYKKSEEYYDFLGVYHSHQMDYWNSYMIHQIMLKL